MNHAITRIVSFLVLAMFLALGKPLIVIVCSVLTLLLYWTNPPEDFRKIARSLYQMKWFFLSIIAVFVLIDTSDISLGSKLSAGLKRILILALMLLLINWIMSKTPRDQMISAIIFLLRPLKYLGFSVESLAIRIELIFQNIETVKVYLLEKKATIKQGKIRISEIGYSVSGLYFDLIKKIDEKSLDGISVDLKSQASLGQWLFPVMLFIILYLIQTIL